MKIISFGITLTDVEIAAKKFIAAIDQHKRYCVIPWQMGVVAKIMQCIPYLFGMH